ncbi:hypothetical protein TNCV_3026281 [Trichonephila clavipes]|nr:hypothetical protein TNCV_3026281 [Trichonephila clavipes]
MLTAGHHVIPEESGLSRLEVKGLSAVYERFRIQSRVRRQTCFGTARKGKLKKHSIRSEKITLQPRCQCGKPYAWFPTTDDAGNEEERNKKRGLPSYVQNVMSPRAFRHASHPFIAKNHQ